MKKIILLNKKIGRYKVLSEAGRDKKGHVRWFCACDCGNFSLVLGTNLVRGQSNSCGCIVREKTGNNHCFWKGGRNKTTNGYIRVLMPDNPGSGKSGYILEHKLVMSNYLGRPLRKDEVIHHKNGIKTDNRIENLELCHRSKHVPGQRNKDNIMWAIEILKKNGYVITKKGGK